MKGGSYRAKIGAPIASRPASRTASRQPALADLTDLHPLVLRHRQRFARVVGRHHEEEVVGIARIGIADWYLCHWSGHRDLLALSRLRAASILAEDEARESTEGDAAYLLELALHPGAREQLRRVATDLERLEALLDLVARLFIGHRGGASGDEEKQAGRGEHRLRGVGRLSTGLSGLDRHVSIARRRPIPVKISS
jgi:hypothetical protein